MSIAVWISRSLIVPASSPGATFQTRAAAPASDGLAAEVPEKVDVPECTSVGAAKVMAGPVL